MSGGTTSERIRAALKTKTRRSSLRVRVAAAILFVALAPQLVVFAWSQVDRSVPGRLWTSVRDGSAEAVAALDRQRGVPADELRGIARARRLRLRVFASDGALLFEEDANDAGDPFDAVEAFVLGVESAPTLHEIDEELGPPLARSEVLVAAKRGVYVACDYRPALLCQAIRAQEETHAIVHVQMTSRRAVLAVYELRRQLLRLSLLTIPFALVMAFTTSRRVVSPIEHLRRQALERANQANPGAVLDPERRDEVGVLADAFNALLHALDEKRAENEAFAADLVHELKNPLAAVRATAEALESGETDPARAARLARVLNDSTTKLDHLATQFLELARAEAGMPNEERSIVDVRALAAGLLERMRDDARHARVTFQLEPADPARGATVDGVSHRLGALLRELLENAASFAGDGGRVTVTVNATEDVVVLTVEDSGPGIAEDDLPKVFTRFFTTRGRQRGTGLGLALVKAVAHAHGGTVEARSRVGSGASFEVRFPRATTARAG